MKWNIPVSDILRGKLVSPGWHPVEIVKYEEKMNKAGDAMNAIVTFRVFAGDFTGVEKMTYFSEKAPGTMTGLLESLGVQANANGLSADLSEATLKGKKLQAHFIRGEYNNKPTNEIIEYAPLG